jgi:uncharacterized protein YjbJ (UPF0337 family)
VEKAEGKMKEAYGALVGDEAKKAEATRREASGAEAEQREGWGRGRGGEKVRDGREGKGGLRATPCRSSGEPPTLVGKGWWCR